jgi:uncharacterized protein (TIGR02466 family)
MTEEIEEKKEEIANVIGLFPQPVFVKKMSMEKYGPLLTTLKTLEYKTHESIGTGTGRDVSEETHVLHMGEFAELASEIQGLVNIFAKEVLSQDVDLRITQSWVNRSETGDWTHEHAHPNSIVSGVWYFSVPENSKIRFHRSTAKSGMYELRPRMNLKDSSDRPWSWDWHDVIVNDGELILFPSYMTHSVPNNLDEKTRWSLAFNTFPVSGIGLMSDLTGLDYNRIGLKRTDV